MAYYRQTYMPGFTTNDTYGNFYDGKKGSLINAPGGLKNYALDVKNSQSDTAGADYGEFAGELLMQQQQQAMQHHWRQQADQQQREPQWPLKPYAGAFSQQDPLDGMERQRGAPPPPLRDPAPLPSSREPPPPVSLERYRNPSAPGVGDLERRIDAAAEAAAEQRRRRSRSPPPPPDLGTYRNNMDVYTGRRRSPSPLSSPPQPPQPPQLPQPPQSPQAPVSLNSRQPLSPLISQPRQQHQPPPPLQLPPQPPQPPQPQKELQPVLRYGSKEIHLPDIEAVELHMRDRSKVILNVREFYNRYLRD